MIDVDAGTPEARWSAWLDAHAPPDMVWPGAHDLAGLAGGPRAAVVVVAPHPDDEVLGVGGTLRVLNDLGLPVRVVAVTDGEASHPGSQAITPTALAAVRAQESERALAQLGLHCPVDRLGLPDGQIERHEDELAGKLGPLLDGAGLVLTTWRHDGHPDHEASGRATAAAAAELGVPLAEYLVWTWNWAAPGDARVPWDRARRVPLSPPVRRTKQQAVAEFRSQITALGPDPEDGPVVPASELAHHRRAFEVVLPWPS